MKKKLVLFWQRYGPPIEVAGLILLIIGSTYMKNSVTFKSIAIAFWIVCLVLYVIGEPTYRTTRFWLFLILGLILATSQVLQLIGTFN
ncbi:hypothetical protein AB6805_22755 [Chitinophaga sp. RCC_12]|uniref:hypothetical protein n=1 Tax=Chitinophaga sp. RCC_12 TaxID=3239226 RepID=UPI0035265C96